MNSRFFIGLIFGLCVGTAAVGAKSSGNSTANFLKMGVGGRGVAMGEAQTAAVWDATSLYWNPAGLGGLTQNEITFMHNNGVQGVTQDVLYFARPTESLGVWGVGGSLLRVDGIKGYSGQDVEIGDIGASDSLLTLGWAKPWDNWSWFPGIQTGANIKILKKTLDTESAVGYMADLGVIYNAQSEWSQGLRTGVVVQNVGTGLDFNGEKSSFPLMLKAGAAYSLFGDNMMVAADVVLPRDGNPYLNGGAEYWVWEILAFRLGYKGNNDLDSGLTYGFGIGNERLHLDYGFIPFGPFGDSHRVSLSLRFGESYRQVQVVSQVDIAYKRALARYAQGYMVEAYMQANQILAVAPWHRPAKLLAKRIETEFKHMETGAQKEQLQAQVDDHFARGEQFFQVDDLLRARREFQAILALQPDHMGAKTYLNRIDERFQSLTEKFYDMAIHAFSVQDFAQAGELLDKVMKLNPDHREARELKERVEQVLKDEQGFAEAKARDEQIEPLMQAGRALYEQKKYEESLSRFNEILKIDTTHAEAMRLRDLSKEFVAKESYNAALRAARDGDMQGAALFAQKALKFKPDYPEARELLNTVGQKKKVVDEVKSKELYKDSLDAFLAGDPQKAMELAVNALELDPNNVEAQRMRDRLAQRGNMTQ
jgi:tetratricopeptide (TPR) repeat protein